MDCIDIKSRDNFRVGDNLISLASCVNVNGSKDLLMLWRSYNEGVKSCLFVVTGLKS